MKADEELLDIMNKYWAAYVAVRKEEFVVRPSIPIIWFGDMDAYKKSDLKVVTVALNPSDREFKKSRSSDDISFFRFPRGEEIFNEDKLTENSCDVLYETLSNYFKTDPYDWFDHFEKPLKCIGASYKTGTNIENIAIHIDAYTPVATAPTWGRLTKEQRQKISPDRGDTIKLFQSFLEYLSPDVILYSVSKDELYNIFGIDAKDDLEKEYGKKGCNISTYKYNNCLIISGRNFRGDPFSGFTDEFVSDTMEKIKQHYTEVFSK